MCGVRVRVPAECVDEAERVPEPVPVPTLGEAAVGEALAGGGVEPADVSRG